MSNLPKEPKPAGSLVVDEHFVPGRDTMTLVVCRGPITIENPYR